jgi:hypothetical protein
MLVMPHALPKTTVAEETPKPRTKALPDRPLVLLSPIEEEETLGFLEASEVIESCIKLAAGTSYEHPVLEKQNTANSEQTRRRTPL